MTASADTRIPTVVELIDFAAAHPEPFTGHLAALIRAELGVTPARFFQLLGRAIASEEAARHDPVTTHRLRRLAEQREHDRAARMTRRQ